MYWEHITTEGERWDQLAARYYGNPYGYEPILRANRHVGNPPVLSGGIRLLIPIPTTPAPSPAGLPPWKRGAA